MAERIIDFVSGIEITATPEEIDSVQVFSRQLVDDYGYPKKHIQTRPQSMNIIKHCRQSAGLMFLALLSTAFLSVLAYAEDDWIYLTEDDAIEITAFDSASTWSFGEASPPVPRSRADAGTEE